GNTAPRGRGRADWHGPPAAARGAEIPVCKAGLVRCLVSESRAEPRHDEARIEGPELRGVVHVRTKIQGGDGPTAGAARSRAARDLVAPRQFFRRLLLRGRIALPPLAAAPVADRARRRREVIRLAEHEHAVAW